MAFPVIDEDITTSKKLEDIHEDDNAIINEEYDPIKDDKLPQKLRTKEWFEYQIEVSRKKLEKIRLQKKLKEKEEQQRPIDRLENLDSDEEFLKDIEINSPKDLICEIKIGEEISYRDGQWFYYESEQSEPQNDLEEESIMDKFLKDCQNTVCMNNEEINIKNRKLFNTKINPINIRELDNIILEVYTLGKLSHDEIESKLKEKYNLELVDDIDSRKIPFFDLEKQRENAYMMTIGESSQPKKPKREYDDIKPRSIEIEGRPPWESPQYEYKERQQYKNHGIRTPIGHTFSENLLIIERASP